MKWFSLIIGGVAGTLCRYLVSGGVYQLCGTTFPYGTLAVNLSGCFIIGFLAGLAEEKFFLGPQMRLLLLAGFCGAYTTFSTFMLETANLMKDGEIWKAAMNLAVSVVAGFIIFRFGILLGDLL